MSDELLEMLGDFFVRYGVGQQYGITFEKYVQLYLGAKEARGYESGSF